MSIETIHNYPILADDHVYNIKWTLLSHVKYITQSKEFTLVWDTPLGDENYMDAIPGSFQGKPIFGVEFMGMQEVAGGKKGVYIISYRGSHGAIKIKSEWGIESPSRKLGFIHDSILLNFFSLERKQDLKIYNFVNGDNVPPDTNKLMHLEFVGSNFLQDEESGERANGIDWTFLISERGFGI